MSIINKNGHRTIATLSSFTISEQTYNCCSGIVPSGTYWALPLHSSDAMRVLIVATVSESTRGYLFGDERFYILFNSSNQVVWSYNNGGSPSVASVALEAGEHTYGFINGRPYYDGRLLINETITANATANVCYLASANNPDPTPLSNAEIKRVEIYGHETNATDSKKTWSYYATRNGTTGYLVEKWSNSIVTNTGGSIGVMSNVQNITYGISIDDLRQVVNTSYYDLVAIYTQDGGTVSPNYYAPEVVVHDNDSTDTHDMAFRWIGRSLPSGYTKQTHPVYDTDSKGIDGELLLGRQPKWNMWADNVNMGRYIYMYDYTGNDQTYRTTLRFNPLVDKYGQDKDFRLEDWENYSPTLYHKPDLRVGNLQGQEMPNFTMEIVNGLLVSSSTDFNIQGSSSENVNRLLTFRRVANIDGELSFVIGNMISWHEEGYSYYNGYDDTGTPIAIPIFGGYFAIRVGDGLYEEESKVVVDGTTLDGTIMMIGYKAEDTELDLLDKDIDATTIYAYREGGIEVGDAALSNMSATILNAIRQYASSHDNIIPCFAEFGLLAANKTYIETAGGTPPLNTLISGRLLAPMKQVEVTLDEKETSKAIFFIDNFDSNLSVICDSTGNSHIVVNYQATTGGNYIDAVVLPLMVKEDNAFVSKKVKATLTAHWVSETSQEFKSRVLGESTSLSFAEMRADTSSYNYSALFFYWRGETANHWTYRNGSPVENVSNYIVDSATDTQKSIPQFIIWNTDGDGWAELITDYKIDGNISFVVTITEIGEEPIVSTSQFTINNDVYYFINGMTWETWVGTEYNTGAFFIDEDEGNKYVCVNIDGTVHDVKINDDTWVEAGEAIEERNYILGEGYSE